MGPVSDLILTYLGSNITGIKLLPGYWNRFSFLRSVFWTNWSSVLLLCMHVCTQLVCVHVLMYLYKHPNECCLEKMVKYKPVSPVASTVLAYNVTLLSLFESHLWALQCKPLFWEQKTWCPVNCFQHRNWEKEGWGHLLESGMAASFWFCCNVSPKATLARRAAEWMH